MARDAPVDPPWPPPLPAKTRGAPTEPPWPQASLRSPFVALEAPPPSRGTDADEAGADAGVVGDGARSSRVAGGAPIDPPRPSPLPNEASGALTEPPRPQAPLRNPLFGLEAPPPSCVTGTAEAGASAGARARVGESCGTVLLLLLLLPSLERRHCRFISAASACQSRRVALGHLSRPLYIGRGAGVGVGAGAGVGTTATSASGVGPRNSAGFAYTDSRVVELK